MTALSTLIGARIRRIDAPRTGLLSIGIFGRALRGTLIFCFAERHAGVGWVETRPHGTAASSFVLKLRKELEGARIEALQAEAAATLALSLRRGEQTTQLRCDFRAAEIQLQRDDTRLSTLALPPGHAAPRALVAWPETLEELAARGPGLLSDSAADAVSGERHALDKLLRTTHKRLERRLSALAEDIGRAEQAEPLRARAKLLLTQQQHVKRGDERVQLIDYSLDPPRPIEITLDPARTLKEQIESWFKQARRFERGAQLARERVQRTHDELARLEALRQQLTAADAADLAELARSARSFGVRGIAAAGRADASASERAASRRHKPFRELRGYKDRTILVGKGAADNDTLTREHARPQDLWLHARSQSGAHVVVPLERNETCPEELLLDAAHLAAHFSAARGETVVDVSYTPKRYVRKVKHSPVGQVQLEREKVLTLHVDAERLGRLLATELQA